MQTKSILLDKVAHTGFKALKLFLKASAKARGMRKAQHRTKTMIPLQDLMGVIPDIGWENFTSNTVAKMLNVDPQHVPSKCDLLKRFCNTSQSISRNIELEDLEGAEPLECVMEVMLCRLELLSPYPALKRIHQDLKEDPFMLKESFSIELLDGVSGSGAECATHNAAPAIPRS